MTKFYRIRKGEIVGEIEMAVGDITVLPSFDGVNTEEFIRADRLETTLKASLAVATAAEVFSKIGLVDKRAVEVAPIVKG